MPSRSNYLLVIAGRLKEDEVEGESMTEIQAEFGPKPDEYAGVAATPEELEEAERSKVTLGEGWAKGFVLSKYKVCDWRRDAERYGKDTLFTFRAEIHHTRGKSLFDNREEMLREVSWFYNYRLYTWYAHLAARLRKLNQKLAAENKLIAPISFSVYQWYCGNGGNS